MYHTDAVEAGMWQMDHMAVDVIDRLIINLESSSDSSDSEDEIDIPCSVSAEDMDCIPISWDDIWD